MDKYRRQVLRGIAGVALGYMTLPASLAMAQQGRIRLAVTPVFNRTHDHVPDDARESATVLLTRRVGNRPDYELVPLSWSDSQDVEDIFSDQSGSNPAWKSLQHVLNRNGLNTARALIPTVTSIDFTEVEYQDRGREGSGRKVKLGVGGRIKLTVSVLLVDFKSNSLREVQQKNDEMRIGPAEFHTSTGETDESGGGVQYSDAVSQLLLNSISKLDFSYF